MKNLKPYPNYKDSNVEWLGDVPEHWEVSPGLKVLKERKEKNKGFIEDTVLSLSYGNVIIKPKEKLTGLVPESFETYQLVYPNDIIFRPTDLQNDKTSLRTGIAKDKGIITNAYLNLQVINSNIPTFVHYFFKVIDNNKVIYGLGSGLRQNIDYRDFRRFPFVVPPKTEQTAIANYLDRKTAQIDEAIAQKERLIELLKERQQIVIHQAVTQGLDSSVEMKDSGVEWIGDVPKHWEVKKLKYVLKERNERSETGEETLLMMSQTYGLVVRADYHDKAVVAQSSVGYKKVYENDLVFNKLKAHLGVFFKSKIKDVGIVSPDYAVYYSIGQIDDLKFLEILFRHPKYIGQFICKATGIVEGLIRLYTDDLFSIEIAVPPKEEQREILEFTNSETTKIQKSIAQQTALIEKLKEYKTVLIDAAVTGKVRVES